MSNETSIVLLPEQQAVIDALLKPGPNEMIDAVAGSGKTFILLYLAKFLKGNVAYAAFSHDIKVEVSGKAAEMRSLNQLACNFFVKTCHGYGLQALKKAFPNGRLAIEDKYKGNEKFNLLLESFGDQIPFRLRGFIKRMYALARQSGVGDKKRGHMIAEDFDFRNKEKWLEIVDTFNLEETLISKNPSYADANEDLTDLVREGIMWSWRIIARGQEPEWMNKIFDREDMIYSVLYHNLKMWQYDIVMGDECQDLNIVRILLIKKMLKPHGRAIFVGDKFQAIFGFTGADAKSMDKISDMFKCHHLPLSYTLRCGKRIVEFVNQWNPGIHALPTAHEGEIRTIGQDDLMKQPFTFKDAILCRNNAPLVKIFFKLLAASIPCHIEAKKGLVDQLIQLVKKFDHIKNISTFRAKLTDYRDKELAKWRAKDREDKIDEVMDITDALQAIASAIPNGGTVNDLINKIVQMFVTEGDTKPQTLTLSSIHSSKGLQYDSVYWYGRNLYNPSPYAKTPDAMQQEINLMYVAGTRAIQTLVDVIAVKE